MVMISVKPFPSEKIPAPMPVLVGTGWIQMIENADFVPEAVAPVTPKVATKDAPASAGAAPVELHQASAAALPAPPMPPTTRTKITMHNGSVMMVEDSFADLASRVG
jgi:hypothetical protein